MQAMPFFLIYWGQAVVPIEVKDALAWLALMSKLTVSHDRICGLEAQRREHVKYMWLSHHNRSAEPVLGILLL